MRNVRTHVSDARITEIETRRWPECGVSTIISISYIDCDSTISVKRHQVWVASWG